MVMLESYWVLRDEKTRLFLVRLAEGNKVSYYLHHSWKEAIKFTGIEDAHALRKKLIGTDAKKSPWIGLKTHQIKIVLE
jgi:predicted DNA-binding protein with PD1-like motif